MLLFTDGFDHYALPAESAANISAYLTAAGYTVTNAANTTFNIAAGQDVNSNGIKMTIVAASNTPPSFQHSFNTVADLIIFGFSFRGSGTRQRIARINGVVDLLWDATTGKLQIGTDVGVDVIILNAFWFIEIEVDKGTNTIRVWANDVLQLTTPLPGTASVTTHTIMWGLNAASTSAATIEVDDFYVVDSSGGQNISRLGPIQVSTRAPSADVTTEWTAIGSTGTHASIAAQLSPNTANAPYLQANVAGKRDRFTSTAVLPNDKQIFAVVGVAYARKGDLDNRSLGITMLTPAAELEVAQTLGTGFAYKQAVFELAPGSVAWNQQLVEASQFGIVAR